MPLPHCLNPSNDVSVTGKVTRPKAMAQNGDLILARLRFFGSEDTPDRWLDTEQLEEAAGRMDRCEAFGGLAISTKIEAFPHISSEGIKYMILLAVIDKVGEGMGPGLRLGRRSVNAHEPFRIRIRQPMEQKRTQQAEHDGVNADTERERESCY